MLIDGLF